MSFSAGEELVVSHIKGKSSCSCRAIVIGQSCGHLQTALQGHGLALKLGNSLHIASLKDENQKAWATVEQEVFAGDVKIVHFGNIRYEGNDTRRATRYPIDVCLTANYSDHAKNGLQTTGVCSEISILGMRAKLCDAVGLDELLRVIIHLAPEKDFEAIARVVRIIKGSEDTAGKERASVAVGGYELGMEFQRIVRGYEHLLEVLPLAQAA